MAWQRASDTAIETTSAIDAMFGVNVSAAAANVSATSRYTGYAELTVNGTEDSLSFAGDYLRNDQSTQGTYGWSANLLGFRSLSANDDVGVSVSELSGSEGGGSPTTQAGWVGMWGIDLTPPASTGATLRLGQWSGGTIGSMQPTTSWAAPNGLFPTADRNDGSVYTWTSSTSTLTLPSSDLADGYLLVGAFEFEDSSNGRCTMDGRFQQTAGTGTFVTASAGGYLRDTSEDRLYVRTWAFIDNPSASATIQFQWKRDVDAPGATDGTVRSVVQVIPLYYTDIGMYTSTSASIYSGTTPNQVTGFSGTDGTNITISSDTITVTGDNKRYLVLGGQYFEGRGGRTQRWHGLLVDGSKEDAAKAYSYYRDASNDTNGDIFTYLLETETASRTIGQFCYEGDGTANNQGGSEYTGSTPSAGSHSLVVIELYDDYSCFLTHDETGGQDVSAAAPVDLNVSRTTDIQFIDDGASPPVTDSVSDGLEFSENFTIAVTELWPGEAFTLSDTTDGVLSSGTTYQDSLADAFEFGENFTIVTVETFDIDGVLFGDVTVVPSGTTYQESLADSFLVGDSVADVITFPDSVSDGVELSDSSAVVADVVASTSDGLEIGDSLAEVITVVDNASDAFEFGDTPTGNSEVVTATSDGVALGDSPSSVVTLPAALTDGVEFGDAPSINVELPVYIADGIALGDNTSEDTQAPVSASDAFEFSDSLAAGADLPANTADGLTLADAIAETQDLVAANADGLDLGDTLIVATIQPESDFDTIRYGDTLSAGGTVPVAASDGLELSDTTSETAIHPVVATDEVHFGDVAQEDSVVITAVSDGLEIGDSTASLSGGAGAVFEGLELSDTTTTQITVTPELTDAFVLGDSNADVITRVAGSEDALKLSDTVTDTQELVAISADGLALGDAVSTEGSATAIIADALEFSDSTTEVTTEGVSLAEEILLGDALSSINTLIDSNVDGFELSDANSVRIDLTDSISDAVIFADISSGGGDTSATDSDTFLLSDAIVLRVDLNESLGEAFILSDTPSTGTNVTVSDTLQFSDTQAINVTFVNTLADGMALGDSTSESTSFATNAADTFTFGDSVSETYILTEIVSDSFVLGLDINTTIISNFDTEGLTLSDSVTPQITTSKSASDGFRLSDQPSSGGEAFGSSTDKLLFTDLADNVAVMVSALTDGLTISDTSAQDIPPVVISDGFVFTDYLYEFDLEKLSDGIIFSDSTFPPPSAAGQIFLTVGSNRLLNISVAAEKLVNASSVTSSNNLNLLVQASKVLNLAVRANRLLNITSSSEIQ